MTVATAHWPVAGQRPLPTSGVRLKIDVQRHYGCWAAGGSYRIRIFEAEGAVPVVVCSQLAARPKHCISTVVESLAATVVARYLPDRLEAPEPVIWLEHYPGDEGRRRRGAGRLDVSRVTFAHWRPTLDRFDGLDRPRVGAPTWTPLTVAEVALLIGDADQLEP